jgi:hypothetical protein
MFVFICIVSIIILAVFLSKKKKPKRSRLPDPPQMRSRITSTSIPTAALDLTKKHFGREWNQFLAGKNPKLKLSVEKIREGIAIGYSQMGVKPLENLLLSFIEAQSDQTKILSISGSFNMNIYFKLHQAVYDLVVGGRFHQISIQTMLSILSEQARIDRAQRVEDNKVIMAENKKRQVELSSQTADSRAKEAVLRNQMSEQARIDRAQRVEDNKVLMAENKKRRVELSSQIADSRAKEAVLRNQMSEQARIDRAQRVEDNKVLIAENKNRQAELRSQIAESSDKEAVLRNQIVEQCNEIKNRPAHVRSADESIIELSSEPVRITLLPEQQRSVEERPLTAYTEYDPDQYSLGKKYKEKLNLNTKEVGWLNKFWNYSNVFNSIEGCEVEIIKLFLLSIKRLNKRLKTINSTLENEIAPLKVKMIAFEKSQPDYWGGYDDVYTGGSVESEAYHFVYKKAESVIRDTWDHKRKISANFSSRSLEVMELFDQRLGVMIEEIIAELVPTIGQPDELTEIALNEATTTRWKIQYQRLTEHYQGNDHSVIIAALHQLGKKNKRNPTVEHIYFEASKFMAPLDKVEALKFYLYYIWKDLNSIVINNKQLNKTIQKKLFTNDDQLQTFQAIIDELVKSRNLTAALKAVEHLYKAKRKSIILNNEAILRVQLQHSGTVEKLNEYLTDDENVYQLNVGETKIAEVVTIQNENELSGEFTPAVALQDFQLECLRMFSDVDYSVSVAEIETYAKSRSMFKNQLIDGINDACNELLDDILIEETEDGYEINLDYYKQILA